MKYAISVILLVFLFSIFVNAADEKDFKRKYMSCLEDANVNIDDNEITISDEDENYTVVITEDDELYVNGEQVELNEAQQELVEEYHDMILEIVDRAKDIGIQGAKLGVDGAKIGLHAVVGVFKLLREDYDSDDLEAELEVKSEELEKKAEELEIEAEKLEYLSDNLEKIHDELIESIPDLEELDSF